MELENLLNFVKKSNRKKAIMGIFIAGLGLFMIILGVVSEESLGDMSTFGIIVGLLFALLFIITGGLMIGISVAGNNRIKKGLHSLQVAISNPNEVSVIWVYEHIVKSSAASNHSLHIYFSNGKFEGVMPGKKNVQPLIQFLMKQYPNARFGFSEEMKKEFNQQKKRFKKKEVDRVQF